VEWALDQRPALTPDPEHDSQTTDSMLSGNGPSFGS